MLDSARTVGVVGIREPADGDEAEIELTVIELFEAPRDEIRFAGAHGAAAFGIGVAATDPRAHRIVAVVPRTVGDEPDEARAIIARYQPEVIELELPPDDPNREREFARRFLKGVDGLLAFADGVAGRTERIIAMAEEIGLPIYVEALIGRNGRPAIDGGG